jgi:hypothetical protein
MRFGPPSPLHSGMMLLGCGPSGGAGFVGPLDNMPGTRLGAWSIGYRLFSDYSSYPLKMRIDDFDQTEIFVPFNGDGTTNNDAIETAAGSDSSFYATVYDQSGNGVDFIQTSSSLQPQYGEMWTDGKISMDFAGGQGLISDGVLPSAATWWGYIVSLPKGGVSSELWALESYPDAFSTYKLLERAFGGKPLYYNNSGGSSAQITYADDTTYSHLAKGGSALRYLKSSAGGVINDTANNSLAGSLSTIGYRNDASAYFTGCIQEWAFFSGTLDSTSEAALWADLNTRWGTPIP